MRDFRSAGVELETVARLVREGIVARVAHGIYQLADAIPRLSRAEAAVRVPRGVISRTSALQFHELTLQMASTVRTVIDRTGLKPSIDHPPVRFVRLRGRAIAGGVKRHLIKGDRVPGIRARQGNRRPLPASRQDRARHRAGRTPRQARHTGPALRIRPHACSLRAPPWGKARVRCFRGSGPGTLCLNSTFRRT